MELSATDQTMQLFAWLLALIEFILAVYVLFFNVWHTANRRVSFLIALATTSSFATGSLIGAGSADQAKWSAALISATFPATMAWLFIATITLLQPAWFSTRLRTGRWLVYSFGILPIILTLIDIQSGASLWHTPLDASTYAGGYIHLSAYTHGTLAPIIRALYLYITPIATFLTTLYVALRDKKTSPPIQRLARLLAGQQIVTFVIQFGLARWLGDEMMILVINAIWALTYVAVTFQQPITRRQLQRGRLQPRLTALIIGITLPIVLGVVLFVSSRASDLLTQNALERLEMANQTLKANVELWLDLNVKALQELVSLPDIVSMDPERQKPFLEAMARAYPHMYLVSTTNIRGINIARSDAEEPKDYHDRLWQIAARNGVPVTFEVLIGRTSNQPALVASMPIRGGLGSIVGVAMFASTLTDLSEQVEAVQIGETGFAYVVDVNNKGVAHPDTKTATELLDFNAYPPVFELRKGQIGHFSFTDESGRRWRAYMDKLDNEWGIIIQQQEDELFATLAQLRGISIGVIMVGSTMLLILAWLTIRQIFRPIGTLTETAAAIAGGDLARTAPIASDDELGALARAFNTMTTRLRVLITSLEQRVAERTHDLERRRAYLEASTEVGRAAASILDPDQLIREVVEIIRQQFDLYYVGLFLRDETDEWAVLQAGTGQAGQKMLARGHRIRVGEGMIGWSIAYSQARVAQAAKADMVRLATAELPETRSEAAIPLRSRGRVLGALTVQDSRPNAFDESAIATLQIMADQVAVALDNARLFTQSQEALTSARRAYSAQSRQGWEELLHTMGQLAFRSDAYGTTAVHQILSSPEMEQALREGQIVHNHTSTGTDGEEYILSVPIKIGADVVGLLNTHKTARTGVWSQRETSLMQAIADQVALALQSARLYQDSQRRANREQLTRQITEKIRATQNIETIAQTATEELARVLGTSRAFVQLNLPVQDGQDRSEPTDSADNGKTDEPHLPVK